MKKFLFKLLLYVIALVLPFALYFAYNQQLKPIYTGSLMGITSQKLELLSKIEGEKIVVLGGSNVIYSVSAKTMSEELGVPVFNMGTTAYLGLPFFLSETKPYLNSGDTVVLSLENAVYSGAVDYKVVWMALENHENVWNGVPYVYLPQLITSYIPFTATKAVDTQTTIVLSKQEEYTNAGFDEFGDTIIVNEENILDNLYNVQDTTYIGPHLVQSSIIKQLNSFYNWAIKNNVNVYLTYAPFNNLAVLQAEDGTTITQNAQEMQNYIQQNCNIPWLGTISDGIMHEDLFYNTNNHLNEPGKIIRTQQLIDELKLVQ